jgi:hypothetical protein
LPWKSHASKRVKVRQTDESRRLADVSCVTLPRIFGLDGQSFEPALHSHSGRLQRSGIMRTSCWRVVGLTIIAILMGSTYSRADEFISEFPSDFDGWQQQWHKESETGTDGVVTHSTDRGFLDDTSLQFDMGDGFGDDGTLWIEKQFVASDSQPTRVSVTFQLFNLEQSDFNAFQVKAAINLADPNEQIDFETIGSTDTAQGWVSFTYEQLIAPTPDQVWVALGIRVAFETHRDYWIDRVVVSTVTVPEPASAAIMLAGLVGMAAFSRR